MGRKLNNEQFLSGVGFLESFIRLPLRELKSALRKFYALEGIQFTNFDWDVEFGLLVHEIDKRRRRGYYRAYA